jgi:hypothetical protein
VSGFHPALTGVLYGALAQHEQALMQMQLAAGIHRADVDEEMYDRYTAIVDGLKRMIKLAEPDEYKHMPIERIEKTQRAHALMGRLLRELADYQLSSWDLAGDKVRAMLHVGYGGSRPVIRAIADQLGLAYDCKVFGSESAKTDYASATGEIDGIEVEVWSLLPAETTEEPADEHRPGTDDDSTADADGEIGDCPNCGGRHRPPWCADLSGPADADDADDDGLGQYTDSQLAGVACTGCTRVFATAEPQVRVAHTLPGGGAVTDIGLYAHPECVDSFNSELGEEL